MKDYVKKQLIVRNCIKKNLFITYIEFARAYEQQLT